MERLLEFLPCVYAFVACAGFCVLFNIHGPGIFFCSLGGALGWLAYLLAKDPAGQLVGYFLATGAFSLFYGGSWQDGLCGGLCGVAIGLCLSFMTRMGANLFFKTIAGAAVSGVLALLLTWVGLGEHTEYIIIGALMALVPGTLFTYAMRDIMAGDMVAGISKGAEALLIGAAIALGTGFALALARSIGG